MEYFEVLLDKNYAIYEPGEKISGNIKLKCIEEIKINLIKIELFGQANVKWIQRRNNRSDYYYPREDKENYINLEKVLKDSETNLTPGEYSYWFEIKLPINLPTSFEHKIGRIRYKIRAVMNRAWSLPKIASKSITVINHVDLNADPKLRIPLGITARKSFCCGPCKSNPIIATLNINKGGFVPGEKIICNVKIDNQSSREIYKMELCLIQHIVFSARHITKISKKTSNITVISVSYPKTISQRKLEKWENVKLTIPPICSTSNGMSRLIDVSYQVLLNFDASFVAFSTDVAIPIIIGTIPIRLAIDNDINYDNDPPPPYSYEPSIFEAVIFDNAADQNGVNESEDKNFKPYYPYFKNI